MEEHSPTIRLGVNLLIIKNGKILLIKRANTGWEDGNYSFPAGHVNSREPIRRAASREAMEEIGLRIKEDDFDIVHLTHHIHDYESISFYLIARRWSGTPRNNEPERCDDVKWVAMEKLPKNVAKNVTRALNYL